MIVTWLNATPQIVVTPYWAIINTVAFNQVNTMAQYIIKMVS